MKAVEVPLVGAVGGSLTGKLWSVGWIHASVPKDALEAIALHPGVQAVTSAAPPTGIGQSRETVRPVDLTGEQT